MTNIKDAPLLPCPFCGGEAESDSQRHYRNMSTGNLEAAAAIYCTSCNADMTWCYRDTPEIERDQVMTLLTEQWNTRASTARPDREKVALLQQFAAQYRSGAQGCEMDCDAAQTVALALDAILATIAPDEAAIRAAAFEEAAGVADCLADEYDATSFTSTNAEQVAALRSKEQAAHEIAAAIRSPEAGR